MAKSGLDALKSSVVWGIRHAHDSLLDCIPDLPSGNRDDQKQLARCLSEASLLAQMVYIDCAQVKREEDAKCPHGNPVDGLCPQCLEEVPAS